MSNITANKEKEKEKEEDEGLLVTCTRMEPEICRYTWRYKGKYRNYNGTTARFTTCSICKTTVNITPLIKAEQERQKKAGNS